MNFSERTKRELSVVKRQCCCEVAALSAFVRTAGSVLSMGGNFGFSIAAQSDCVEYFAGITESLYDAKPIFTVGAKSRISGFTVLDDKSYFILFQLGILRPEGGNMTVCLEPDNYLVENDCCKRAYVAGAFMGGGSLTVPDTDGIKRNGYHLEFVFSKYLTARNFSDLLASEGFMPKLILRKGYYVVYFKQNEEISGILVYMGAEEAAKELSEIVAIREVKNQANRESNCIMYNLDKIISASEKQRAAIRLIEDTVGLDRLPDQLSMVARARLKYDSATLSELAETLNITKSCLNHRLRKLSELAEDLQ